MSEKTIQLAIATNGLWRGASLYDITLSDDAHLVVLYDNNTGTVSMCPWPDPTSPETGYLYVSPLDRDSVLRRIAERVGALHRGRGELAGRRVRAPREHADDSNLLKPIPGYTRDEIVRELMLERDEVVGQAAEETATSCSTP